MSFRTGLKAQSDPALNEAEGNLLLVDSRTRRL